jgi:hypothetical protein
MLDSTPVGEKFDPTDAPWFRGMTSLAGLALIILVSGTDSELRKQLLELVRKRTTQGGLDPECPEGYKLGPDTFPVTLPLDDGRHGTFVLK